LDNAGLKQEEEINGDVEKEESRRQFKNLHASELKGWDVFLPLWLLTSPAASLNLHTYVICAFFLIMKIFPPVCKILISC